MEIHLNGKRRRRGRGAPPERGEYAFEQRQQIVDEIENLQINKSWKKSIKISIQRKILYFKGKTFFLFFLYETLLDYKKKTKSAILKKKKKTYFACSRTIRDIIGWGKMLTGR